MCTKCGSGYNVAFINSGEYYMPPLLPKVEGICDSCGTPSLVQRHDDTPEVVQQRWVRCFDKRFGKCSSL